MSDKKTKTDAALEGCVFGCFILCVCWAIAFGVASVFWIWRVALG